MDTEKEDLCQVFGELQQMIIIHTAPTFLDYYEHHHCIFLHIGLMPNKDKEKQSFRKKVEEIALKNRTAGKVTDLQYICYCLSIGRFV